MKNPKQHEALLAKRERQRVEGAIAMREYLAAQEATRRKTKKLRALRLAKTSDENQESAVRRGT